MNINDIPTSSELKYRLTHKDDNYQKKEEFFTFEKLRDDDWSVLSDCHIDPFTGYKNKDGKDVYGGDILQGITTGVVCWSNYTGEWYIFNLKDPNDPKPETLAGYGESQSWSFQIIGNTHNVDALPEEVRKMIEGSDEKTKD